MNTKSIKRCVVAVLAMASACFANAQETSPDHIKEILALAEKSAEDDFNVNFCGFFTGMSRYDAQDLAAYYKLKEDEYVVNASPGKAVRRLWFSLKGVRRITRAGSTVEELAQAVANRVGDLKGRNGEWEHKTIDGIVVTFSSEGLTIQNDQVASKTPLATVNAARKHKADMDAAAKAAAEAAARRERAIKEMFPSLLREMIEIPGRSFLMGKYEVTQAQWQAVMGENPSRFKGDLNPVEQVSWNDCKKFLEKLNSVPEVKASGLTFRLPTEKEWEYACRAGSTGDFCKLADGTEITKKTLGKVAWYDANSDRMTHSVGRKMPNAFGLYDMHGNVWEWCEDLSLAGGSYRVFRGGCWDDSSGDCTAGSRYFNGPDSRVDHLGFRLAASQD